MENFNFLAVTDFVDYLETCKDIYPFWEQQIGIMIFAYSLYPEFYSNGFEVELSFFRLKNDAGDSQWDLWQYEWAMYLHRKMSTRAGALAVKNKILKLRGKEAMFHVYALTCTTHVDNKDPVIFRKTLDKIYELDCVKEIVGNYELTPENGTPHIHLKIRSTEFLRKNQLQGYNRGEFVVLKKAYYEEGWDKYTNKDKMKPETISYFQSYGIDPVISMKKV